MVVQSKVKAKGGAIFGAALLRPKLRARLIMVVQGKVKAKIFGAAQEKTRKGKSSRGQTEAHYVAVATRFSAHCRCAKSARGCLQSCAQGCARGLSRGCGHALLGSLLRQRLHTRLIVVVQHKVNATGGAVFGAALLRPRLRARLIMVVQGKVMAKGGAIFSAAQATGNLDGIELCAETIRAAAERIGEGAEGQGRRCAASWYR